MNKKALLVIFFTVFIDLMGFGIVIPLSPYLARKFQADPLEIGLLMTIYSLMQFLFSPLWGRVSDRVGRRPILLMSLLGASLSHLFFAFSSHLWMLFVARAFAGIFGASISTAFAYVADVTPKEDRSKSMGLVGAALGLGFMTGPVVGGLLGYFGENLGSTPPFGQSFAAVGASLICICNFLFALKYLKESLPKNLQGRAKVSRSRWTHIARCIRRPVMGPVMFMFFLSSVAMANMESSLFLFMDDKFNWDFITASYGFAYVGLIMVLTQGLLIRRIMPLWGEKRVLLIGGFVCALGLLGIGLSPNIAGMAVSVTLLALGSGLMNPAMSGSISLLAKDDEQGESLGVHHSMSALGRILGPIMGGWLYRDYSQNSPFFAASLITLGAVFIAISIYSRLPESGKLRTAPNPAPLD